MQTVFSRCEGTGLFGRNPMKQILTSFAAHRVRLSSYRQNVHTGCALTASWTVGLRTSPNSNQLVLNVVNKSQKGRADVWGKWPWNSEPSGFSKRIFSGQICLHLSTILLFGFRAFKCWPLAKEEITTPESANTLSLPPSINILCSL